MRHLLALLFLSFLACGGGGSESNSASSVCVAGDNVFEGVPEDQVDEIIEAAQGEDVVVEDSGELDQSSALKLYKVTIIGSCNDVHTEDNDTSTTTNVQLGQQN